MQIMQIAMHSYIICLNVKRAGIKFYNSNHHHQISRKESSTIHHS